MILSILVAMNDIISRGCLIISNPFSAFEKISSLFPIDHVPCEAAPNFNTTRRRRSLSIRPGTYSHIILFRSGPIQFGRMCLNQAIEAQVNLIFDKTFLVFCIEMSIFFCKRQIVHLGKNNCGCLFWEKSNAKRRSRGNQGVRV